MKAPAAIRPALAEVCLECRAPREHDGLLVCRSCFSAITGVPWQEIVLDAHRTVCGFYSIGQPCSTCFELEQNSPLATPRDRSVPEPSDGVAQSSRTSSMKKTH